MYLYQTTLVCWIVESSARHSTVSLREGFVCRQVEEKERKPVSGWLSLQVHVRTHFNSWLYGSSCAIINSNSREIGEGAKLYVIQWESTTANSSVWNSWWSVHEVTIHLTKDLVLLTQLEIKHLSGTVQKSPELHMWWATLMNSFHGILKLPNSYTFKTDKRNCLTLARHRLRQCSTNFGGFSALI